MSGLAAGAAAVMGGRRRTLKLKTLKRMLKKQGKKVTGKKSTLMKRLHMRGGATQVEKDAAIAAAKLLPDGEEKTKAMADAEAMAVEGGRRKTRRRGFRLF
jgi:hypothetical protein